MTINVTPFGAGTPPLASVRREYRVLGSVWSFSVSFQTPDGSPVDYGGSLLTPVAELEPGYAGSPIGLTLTEAHGNQAKFAFDSAQYGIVPQGQNAASFPIRLHAFLIDEGGNRHFDVICGVVAVDPKVVDLSTLPDPQDIVAVSGPPGPRAFGDITAWATGNSYISGPPASLVTANGGLYACLTPHIASASFAADLAEGCWVAVLDPALLNAAAGAATDAATAAGISATGAAQSKASTDADVTSTSQNKSAVQTILGQVSGFQQTFQGYLASTASNVSLAQAASTVALAQAQNVVIPARANVPKFSTFLSVAALSLGLSVGMTFETQGYAAPGDGGAAAYKVIASPVTTTTYSPRYAGTSADGKYYRYLAYGLGPMGTWKQFGGVADGIIGAGGIASGTDNYPAFRAAQECYSSYEYSASYVGTVPLSFGNEAFFVGQAIDNKFINYWFGCSSGYTNEGASSSILFPPGIGVGFTNNHYNTAGGTTAPNTTTGQGSIYQGLRFYGSGGFSTADYTSHGFWMRATCVIKHCIFEGWNGNGVLIKGTVGGPGAFYGTNNGFNIDLTVQNVGGHGIEVVGNDSNAGTIGRFQCLSPIGLCGIKDGSGLGANSWTAEIDAYDASLRGICSFGGQNYILLSDVPGIGASTTPGTQDAIWYPTGVAATNPAWSSSGTYQVALPFWSLGNASTTSLALCLYTEGGISYAGTGTVAIGGQCAFTGTSGHLRTINGVLIGSGGIGARTPFLPLGNQFGALVYKTIGPSLSTGVLDEEYIDASAFVWQRRAVDAGFNRIEGWALDSLPPNRKSVGYRNSTEMGGRATPLPALELFPQLAISDGALINARIVKGGAAAPTSGAWATGDLILDNAAGAGRQSGWRCVVTGLIATSAWPASTAVAKYATCTNDSGKSYVCTTAGTTAASGGPTGTGTGISDGAAVWSYVQPFVFAPFGATPIIMSSAYGGETISAGAVGATTNVSVAGVVLGDKVIGSAFSLNRQGVHLNVWASAAGQVSYRFENPPGASSVTLASGTVTANLQH